MRNESSAHMDIEIRGSGIHKRGVHALRDFRAGEVVWAWDTSHRVPLEQASCYASQDIYLHPYDAATFFVVQSPECFVNHSCDNNTVVRNFMDVAIRNIRAGEEITSNYETDGAGQSFVCGCGAPNCRGVIGGAAGDTQPPHAQQFVQAEPALWRLLPHCATLARVTGRVRRSA